MLNKISIWNNRMLENKVWKFFPMFIALNIFAFTLIFLILFLLYFPPSKSLPIEKNQVLTFGFYWINVTNNIFGHVYINWFSIALSIFSILYVFYECFFYWIYWNRKWSKYISNSKLTTFMIITGVIIIGGIIVGFINSPFLDFSLLDPLKGLDSSTLLKGVINYNFIYNCNFIKNDAGIITSDYFIISEYGILLIVIQTCLIFSLIITTILIAKRKK